MTQPNYVLQVLKFFRMNNYPPTTISMLERLKLMINMNAKPCAFTYYLSMVEKLNYLTYNCFNISTIVNICLRFLLLPQKSHLIATKQIIRYIKHTSNYRIFYLSKLNTNIIGFVDTN